VKVKTILRKVNRGLVLGLVLLIGLAVFIVADELSFQKQRPQIQETLEAYLQDVAKISILPEAYQKLGVKTPADVLDKKKAEVQTVLDQYWTASGSDVDSYMFTKEVVKSEWNNMLENNAKGNGYVTKWTGISNGNVKISKTGPGRAMVIFPYSVVLEIYGEADSNHMTGVIYAGEKYNGENTPDEVRRQEHKYSLESDLQVEMLYTDGQWKILSGTAGHSITSAVAAE
jgi:hypothetical protein